MRVTSPSEGKTPTLNGWEKKKKKKGGDLPKKKTFTGGTWLKKKEVTHQRKNLK